MPDPAGRKATCVLCGSTGPLRDISHGEMVCADSTSCVQAGREATPTYRRDRNGEVVHRSDCRTLSTGQGSDWNFADGMTGDELLRVVAANRWLRPCKVCKPTAGQS